jgi:hypothetical protein
LTANSESQAVRRKLSEVNVHERQSASRSRDAGGTGIGCKSSKTLNIVLNTLYDFSLLRNETKRLTQLN